MSATLLAVASQIELPAEQGLSSRAARAVLKVYCRLADSSGGFRFGIRGSKVAQLADYSLATVRRAQRYLVENGFLVKVQIGGGRKSTRWRLVLERLGLGHTSDQAVTPHQPEPETAQAVARIYVRPSSRGPAGMSPHVEQVCEHGGSADLLPSGLPRCPICRRLRC